MKTGHVELVRAQQGRWRAACLKRPGLYGVEPSVAVRWAVGVFGAGGIDDVLELGAGHGRDAVFLARQGVSVHGIDFSAAALEQLRVEAQWGGADDRVTAALRDVRDPLPPGDATVDAVFANLLLSMGFSRAELRALVAEICPGGVFVAAVWSADDPCPRHWKQLEDGLAVRDGFVGRLFDESLVQELADQWRLGEMTPYQEGPRRLWRVVLHKER